MRANTDRTLDFLRGVGTVPPDLAARQADAVKRRLEAAAAAHAGPVREAAKAWRRLATPGAKVGEGSAEAARAVAGLRAVSDRLAKRKLVLPSVPRVVPGLTGAALAANFVPPFDFASDFAFVHIGSANVSSSSDKRTGDLDIEVATQGVRTDDTVGTHVGVAHAETGIFVLPPFPRGRLRVSVSPSFSFAWWINSVILDGHTFARASLVISAFKGTNQDIHAGGGVSQTLWSHTKFFIVDFEVGSQAALPLTAEVEIDDAHFYAVAVAIDCNAIGGGWPGSLAGARVVMKVPFFSLEIEETFSFPQQATTTG